MLECVNEIVTRVELSPEVNDRRSAFSALKELGLDDFGEVLSVMPNPKFPKLSKLLPAMPTDQVQIDWTGNSGLALLKQTTGFVRTLSYAFSKITGRTLNNLKVLDYGCGYGRIARLMYYFTDEARCYGVDPWDKSIGICRDTGLNENFVVSDYLPKSLPISVYDFDLIYAFSVFTHLSERAALTALSTLRNYISPVGVLVITIRPVEYWHHDIHASVEEKKHLMDLHRDKGFAFKPHKLLTFEGEITYGDTSITLNWIAKNVYDWEVVLVDRLLQDPFQRYIFLRPKSPGIEL